MCAPSVRYAYRTVPHTTRAAIDQHPRREIYLVPVFFEIVCFGVAAVLNERIPSLWEGGFVDVRWRRWCCCALVHPSLSRTVGSSRVYERKKGFVWCCFRQDRGGISATGMKMKTTLHCLVFLRQDRRTAHISRACTVTAVVPREKRYTGLAAPKRAKGRAFVAGKTQQTTNKPRLYY